MKKLIILCIGAAALLFSCSAPVETELTEEQKDEIKTEILESWNKAGKGIEELNAELAFSFFSNRENTKYIRNGYLYPSVEKAKNEYAGWFSAPNTQKQKIVIDTAIFDIINNEIVLMTTIAKITKVDIPENEQTPWVIAYTLLWEHEEDGWKVLNMHNSWE